MNFRLPLEKMGIKKNTKKLDKNNLSGLAPEKLGRVPKKTLQIEVGRGPQFDKMLPHQVAIWRAVREGEIAMEKSKKGKHVNQGDSPKHTIFNETGNRRVFVRKNFRSPIVRRR